MLTLVLPKPFTPYCIQTQISYLFSLNDSKIKLTSCKISARICHNDGNTKIGTNYKGKTSHTPQEHGTVQAHTLASRLQRSLHNRISQNSVALCVEQHSLNCTMKVERKNEPVQKKIKTCG